MLTVVQMSCKAPAARPSWPSSSCLMTTTQQFINGYRTTTTCRCKHPCVSSEAYRSLVRTLSLLQRKLNTRTSDACFDFKRTLLTPMVVVICRYTLRRQKQSWVMCVQCVRVLEIFSRLQKQVPISSRRTTYFFFFGWSPASFEINVVYRACSWLTRSFYGVSLAPEKRTIFMKRSFQELLFILTHDYDAGVGLLQSGLWQNKRGSCKSRGLCRPDLLPLRKNKWWSLAERSHSLNGLSGALWD